MKTNEWIVSPKALKENQERAIKREKELEKTKQEERKNKVKTIVLTIAGITIMALLIIYMKHDSEEFMKKCQAGGNSYTFCQKALDGQA